jgi:hypothetical protein
LGAAHERTRGTQGNVVTQAVLADGATCRRIARHARRDGNGTRIGSGDGRMRPKVGNCRAHGLRSPRHVGRMRAGTGELSMCGGTAGWVADRLSGTIAERLGHG